MRTLTRICAISLFFVVALTANFTVQGADLTWDPGQTGSSDGAGTWLNPNVWDNGGPATWTSGDNATIGNGGAGGIITVGGVSAGTITFTNFSGTYTLAGDTSSYLDQSGGIKTSTNSGKVTMSKRISGSGGLTVSNAPGTILLIQTPKNNPNTYTGPTVVNGGILQCGTSWDGGADGLPGGIGDPTITTGSNLELNGGTFTCAYYFRRRLGADPGAFQITGGSSGFNHLQNDTYGRIAISNSTSLEIVWGSPYFKPDELVLNEAGGDATQVVNIQNPIDLNGSDRTVACNATKSISVRVDANNGWIYSTGGRLTGVIRNSGGTAAGLIKVGPGELQLAAANTYDGATWIKNGILSIYSANNCIPTGSTLTLGDGTDSATFKLNGYSQTLTNGLLTSGSGTENRVVNGFTTEATLTVNVASGVNTFSGIIGGSTADENFFNLTKTGAGELSVRQVNNSRITSVQEGVLRVTESYGSDAKISISAGATNILDFAGTYAIHSLLLDGTPATAGTWGGPSSGAPNTSTLLDGTGMISISGNYSTYYWDGPNVGGTGDGAGAGGSGTWSTSTDNWDVGLAARRVWPSTPTNIDAVFAGATGYVTVAENLYVSNITITVTSPDDYTIAGNALVFASDSSLTIASSYNNNWTEMVTIESTISNAPTINLDILENTEARFAPTNGSMSLGAVSDTAGNGNPGCLQLAGSTTGNTVASVRNNKVRCVSGEWTLLGDAYQRNQHFVDGGTLIVNGDFSAGNAKGIRVSSNATIVVNGSVGKVNAATTLTFLGNSEGDPYGNWRAGGTLSGTGVVYKASSTNQIFITQYATVAPGYPTGTLTISNQNCRIDGTLAIVFDGAECSRLLVDGVLDISAGTSTLDVNTAGASGTEFIIATFDSMTGSAFAATNNLPSSWAVVYEATQIKLVPPPGGTVIMFK